MPAKSVTPEIAAKVADLPTAVGAMSAEKQERVAALIEQIAAEPDPPAPLDSAAVTAAYDALDAEGQERITLVLGRQAERMARQTP